MSKRITAFLHRAARGWVDGLHAGLDVLLWGNAYPRRVSLQDLQRGDTIHFAVSSRPIKTEQ